MSYTEAPCMSCGESRHGPAPDKCLDKKNHLNHNHITRDTKPKGQCPGCDDYLVLAAERRKRFEDQGKLVPGTHDHVPVGVWHKDRVEHKCILCGHPLTREA